jgi:hypothetical protein
VLRLNLQGLNESQINNLKDDIHLAPGGAGLPPASTEEGQRLRTQMSVGLLQRAVGDDHKRYVNVALGRLHELAELPEGETEDHKRTPTAFTQWWLSRGWEVTPDPAPMLRSTVRGTQPSLMPYSPGSLASTLKAEFEEAIEAAEAATDSAAMDEVAILPMTLAGRPKWNSHSCRRGGAKKAQDMADDSKADPSDINRHFGWLDEAMKGGKRRQTAYASTLPVLRRLRVTNLW